MATVSEFTQQVALFVEALERLQADKSEVVSAQEQLAAAQAALAKEQGDVTGAAETLTGVWTDVKMTGDSLVYDLIGPELEPIS